MGSVVAALSRWFPASCALLLAVCLLPAVARAGNGAAELRFGVFAYLGEERTRAKYRPLADYLNDALPDLRVRLEVLPLDGIHERIADGSLDIVTTNPNHFIVSRGRQPLTGVIATLVESYDGRALDRLGGAILVEDRRTDLTRPADLRGRIIAAPSTEHIGGYRAQALELLEAGVRLPADATVVEVGQHDTAVQAVLDGRADAAFVRNGVLEHWERSGKVAPGRLRLINERAVPGFPHRVSTRLYPEWPVFALPHVNERVVRRVAAALFALEPDHPAAVAAGIHGYTIPADYLPVEELARTLRLPPFDRAPDVTRADLWRHWGTVLSALAAAGLVAAGSAAVLMVALGRERAARHRFQTLLSSLGEGVYGVDRQGLCTFINPAALRMLGFTRDEVVGHDQHALFHHRRPDGSPYPHGECPVRRTLEDGASRETEEVFWRKSGEPLPIRLKVEPVHGVGADAGAVVTFADISELKAAVDDLARSNADLEQFAYVVSHDLRQPLRMVSSYTQLLARSLGDSGDTSVREFMGFIRDGARRMDQMLVSLLEYSRVGRGGEPMEDLDSRALADEAIRFLSPAIAEAGARVTIEGDWPTVRASRNEAVRLFQNLIGNAVKYRAPGFPPVVDLSVRPVAGAWEFTVRDNGIGIDPAQFGRLFKVFQRLHVRDAYEGTGIGLAICRRIVERHGGTITVESEGAGRGSAFRFTLPDTGAAPAAAPRSASCQESRP
ncbi:PhnD/SsuA/transferrin family substrate-binding protein [Azospirillum halopraeferens]|uniref:PhnD/SsuA/transferrin family substrate-binding protein n=1 Tax=Azospirillum halopraeferens TaxID=34010 RepID=UPI000411CA9E|nr:PhnD/SsuA/transferrin family substrate-binding protein [Azospirillum halopraeferens]